MTKKLSYAFVKEYIEKEGFTLLSTKYENAHSKLDWVCPKGHVGSSCWNNFQRGDRCSACSGIKKLDIATIKDSFEKEDYILLSENYINSKSSLDCICPSGHTYTTNWTNFNAGSRCPICVDKNIKYKYEYIKNYFLKEDYTLLSTTYTGRDQKLFYKCPNGHEHSVTWANFKKGHRCAYCAGVVTYTYDFIKEAFLREGYTLLSESYSNAHTRLDYICNKGHTTYTTWNSFRSGKRCYLCNKESRSGEGSSQWKGGVSKSNLPLYTTHANKFKKYQAVHKVYQNNLELLGVECKKCGQIFVPHTRALQSRLAAIKGTARGENHLYCSDECKQVCSIFGQVLWPKEHKPYKEDDRPDQKQWATMVKERDNHTCQKCGTSEGQMIAHHIDPVINNPIESTDIDNGITLCGSCDKLLHKLPGCTYQELRCPSK